ncbi:MAG: DUF4276 family protein [Thermodesulfobacteriota bacterium]|nr:DUF4276 family protein [Thermodesulfobacteriota bacterium]
MVILYFLEDRAQEGFIKALVERVAKEEAIVPGTLIHQVRSARGGYRVIAAFRKFIKDTIKRQPPEADFLIVAIDGNCKGHKERVKELERFIKPTHPFKNKIIYAVPDPHIERWYIIDQRAFKDGVGLNKGPDLPPYKCKKEHYKQVLNRALRESKVNSLLGGVEYAEKIIDNIENLDLLAKQNAGFQNFVEDLRSAFRKKVKN